MAEGGDVASTLTTQGDFFTEMHSNYKDLAAGTTWSSFTNWWLWC